MDFENHQQLEEEEKQSEEPREAHIVRSDDMSYQDINDLLKDSAEPPPDNFDHEILPLREPTLPKPSSSTLEDRIVPDNRRS